MFFRACLTSAILGLLCADVCGEVLRFHQKHQWETWSYPHGVVELREDGGIALMGFERDTDPLLDAPAFERKTILGETVHGGVRVWSNPGMAPLLSDRDEGTWWKPDPSDALEDWEVEVDLGRLVLLRKIRLVFPDTVGARPFEDFSIYVSEGATFSDGDVLFTPVATTTRPNRERVLEYDLFTEDRGDQATGEYLVTHQRLPFRPAQYVCFMPHQRTQDAALAEIEMVAVGDNIGLGTLARGGGIRAGEKFALKATGVFDGTVDGYWNASARNPEELYWREGGQWFEWDLGVAFWLDEIVLYTWDPAVLGGFKLSGDSGQLGYELSISDGRKIAFAGGGEDRIRGNIDYERLSLVDNTRSPGRWIFDHRFPRRKVRYLFYHHDVWWCYAFNLYEVFLFGQGYPAEVELESDFIDLGESTTFTNLAWEADVPPETSVRICTRTGDTLDQKTLYYDKNGKRIPEEHWKQLPNAARGPVRTFVHEGMDWSGWSEPYMTPDEAFCSPSPRRYVRIKLTLSTDDPAMTPILRSMSLFFQPPLMQQGVSAEVFPREAGVGVWEEFCLRIKPVFTPGDRGFDGVWMVVPCKLRGISVQIGGREVSDVFLESRGDTLRLELPRSVHQDSVDVRFTARLLENPTFFEIFLVSSSLPDVRQGVRPTRRDALKVFLPDIAAKDRLIANLQVSTLTGTPNGDGINDEIELRFDLLKVDRVPQVGIYDLQGQRVRRLPGHPGKAQHYVWDGRRDDRSLVLPGVYIWRIRIDAEIGTQAANQPIGIVY